MSDSPYSGSAVKRSTAYFLVGKVVSALLNFTILLWLVRLLTVPEYATYITLVASMEIAFCAAGLGIPWMEGRYFPEYRLHASKEKIIRFAVQLILCQVGVLLIVALAAWSCLDWLLIKMEMSSYREAAQLYLLMLVVDGAGRRLRDGMLSALLLQKLSQISLVTRNFLFVASLGVLVYLEEINLVHVIEAELFASSVGVMISLFGLWRHLKLIEVRENPEWQAPKWSQMWAVARNMYFSTQITQVYSAPVFILIIHYSFGTEAAEATAVFGFLCNLYVQVGNYLPAVLLFGLIRPKLVASYVGDGGIVELTRNANMVGKFSLFVLMPLLVFSGLAGEVLVELLSGGKFQHTGYYLAGLMCVLIPLSQRQILETVAVVTGNSHLCNYAATLGIFTLPIAFGLIKIGFGLWAPIIAFALGNLIFCSTIVRGVAKKTSYHADFAGFCRMLLSAAIAYLGAMLLVFSGQNWVWIIAVAILACITFLLAGGIIKPFSEYERSSINQIIKRNLFIW
jgi:O-antigen/teichoic acid export membrane protein